MFIFKEEKKSLGLKSNSKTCSWEFTLVSLKSSSKKKDARRTARSHTYTHEQAHLLDFFYTDILIRLIINDKLLIWGLLPETAAARAAKKNYIQILHTVPDSMQPIQRYNTF